VTPVPAAHSTEGPSTVAGVASVNGGTTVGGTARCVAPRWDPWRGLLPGRVSFRWVTVTVIGPFVIPTPIDGASAATLVVGPDLAGASLACQVSAASPGGTTTVLSDAVTVG
jgi:hypothetical protein